MIQKSETEHVRNKIAAQKRAHKNPENNEGKYKCSKKYLKIEFWKLSVPDNSEKSLS